MRVAGGRKSRAGHSHSGDAPRPPPRPAVAHSAAMPAPEALPPPAPPPGVLVTGPWRRLGLLARAAAGRATLTPLKCPHFPRRHFGCFTPEGASATQPTARGRSALSPRGGRWVAGHVPHVDQSCKAKVGLSCDWPSWKSRAGLGQSPGRGGGPWPRHLPTWNYGSPVDAVGIAWRRPRPHGHRCTWENGHVRNGESSPLGPFPCGSHGLGLNLAPWAVESGIHKPVSAPDLSPVPFRSCPSGAVGSRSRRTLILP